MNAHSRAVLVPLPRAPLPPSAISVAGPGPSESHNPETTLVVPTQTADIKPAPPVPPEQPVVHQQDADTSSDHEDDEPRGGADPYSNLDGAFGNYLADEPRPITAGNSRVRHGDEDDLLF